MSATATSSRAVTLLLADARLPSGAHVHSGSMEQAVDDGVVVDLSTLATFLQGKLLTSGRLSAHVAARACALVEGGAEPGGDDWRALSDELGARLVSPALRSISHRQGRSLLRTGRALFDDPVLAALERAEPEGPHLAVVQGAVAAAAGLGVHDAALLAIYSLVTTGASAALRLLGLDPLSTSRLESDLTPLMDEVAAEAAAHSSSDPQLLPAEAAPATDRLAERHAERKERLFAS